MGAPGAQGYGGEHGRGGGQAQDNNPAGIRAPFIARDRPARRSCVIRDPDMAERGALLRRLLRVRRHSVVGHICAALSKSENLKGGITPIAKAGSGGNKE